MDIPGFLTSIGQASNIAFPFIDRANAFSLNRRALRADETVALAQLGFTTGRAQIATVPRGQFAPNVNLGGVTSGLGSLGQYAPLLLLAGAAFLLVRR